MLMRFMDSLWNFLTQIAQIENRQGHPTTWTMSSPINPSTTLSDHKLVEIVLGCNLLAEETHPTNNHQETDNFSFRAVNCYEADFPAMNEELAAIGWNELYRLCEDDTEGSLFLKLLRLQVLQVTAPRTSKSEIPWYTPQQYYTLKRRREETEYPNQCPEAREPKFPETAKAYRGSQPPGLQHQPGHHG